MWIIMPVLAQPAYTEAALSDCLAQTIPTQVLVVNQGVDADFRLRLERLAEAEPRLWVWSHQPPLPSLAATWNRALDFCWAAGAQEALVVNNDVRLAPNTCALLSEEAEARGALFVSAVGVSEAQFTPGQLVEREEWSAGGPDFSCFLIERECHASYRFDEQFIPAYCEDLDYHRRLLLDGHGARIYSINVPYLHHAATTLKTVSETQRASIERRIASGSRAHYLRKWGGPVNQERYLVAYDDDSDADDVTTPQLQAAGGLPWANASKTSET